jgi:hypothetical protein
MKRNEKIANQKKESREIVKKIIDFGVTEEQKLDIMYFLSMNLNDNQKMKDICCFLENFINKINNEKDDDKIISQSQKIILT